MVSGKEDLKDCPRLSTSLFIYRFLFTFLPDQNSLVGNLILAILPINIPMRKFEKYLKNIKPKSNKILNLNILPVILNKQYFILSNVFVAQFYHIIMNIKSVLITNMFSV